MSMKNVLQNVDTRLIPIIGYPMAQSSASFAYNYLFEAHQKNAIMWPLEIARGNLPAFFKACETVKTDRFTVTMPHKSDILPLLQEVEPSSKLFGSVNAVKHADGKWHGVSCDGKGCIAALLNKGRSLAGKHVVMIGAGGISGVIGYELSKAHAKSLTIINRSLESARKVAEILNEHTDINANAEMLNAKTLARQAERAEVLLQCTPLGMKGYGIDHADLEYVDRLDRKCIVMETIVNPYRTSFVQKVESKGLLCIHGVDMLAFQLGEIFDFWFQEKVSPEEIGSCREIVVRYLSANRA